MANLFFKSDEIARAVACSTSGFTLGLFHTTENTGCISYTYDWNRPSMKQVKGLGLGYLLPAVIVTNQHIGMSKEYLLQYRFELNETWTVSSEFSNATFLDYKLMNKQMFWLHLSSSQGLMNRASIAD